MHSYSSSVLSRIYDPLNISKRLVLDRSLSFSLVNKDVIRRRRRRRKNYEHGSIVASGNVAAPLWDSWKPPEDSSAPSLSDILWPAAGLTWFYISNIYDIACLIAECYSEF